MALSQALVSILVQSYLAHCFESGQMKPFPSTPSVKEAPWTQVMNIYCCCKMLYALEHLKSDSVPYGEVTEMIQYNICLSWYHHNCVDLTIEDVKNIRELQSFGCVITMVLVKPLQIFLTLILSKYNS